LFDVIDEMNKNRGRQPKKFWTEEKGWHTKYADPIIEKDEEFKMLGYAIDSMGALDLVLHLEEQLEKRGKQVSITTNKAFSQTKTPLKTVGTIITMVEGLA